MRSFRPLVILVVVGPYVVSLGCGSGDESTTDPGAIDSDLDALSDSSSLDSGPSEDADSAVTDATSAETGDSGTASSSKFAVIGDFGSDGTPEADVAKLVKSWKVDFVVTTGDNNYPDGAASTIDRNIGKHYAEFIGSYKGTYGPGSTANRFWPSPGNHDWNTPALAPYLDYFTLPGIERYYDKDLGLVHLFAIDSDGKEPDTNTEGGTQGKWLKTQLEASKSCWDFVYFHHPAYNSGSTHGSTTAMRWAFKTWGADAVFQGHEHVYERLEAGGLLYITSGLAGASRYDFGTPLPESKFRYRADYGALLVTVDKTKAVFEFWNRAGTMIDSYTLTKTCP